MIILISVLIAIDSILANILNILSMMITTIINLLLLVFFLLLACVNLLNPPTLI